MYKHTCNKRVRYSETDRMGYLYYGRYANYYEIGRVEMLRSLGLTYKDMEEVHDILMPVMNMQCRYIRPATYDDNLRIVTELREWPERSMRFYSSLYNEADMLVNTGTVTLCFIDKHTAQRVDTPDYLLQKLRPYFEAATT